MLEFFGIYLTPLFLLLNSVKSFVQQNGILLEVEVAIQPFNDASIVNVFFNNLTNQATLNP